MGVAKARRVLAKRTPLQLACWLQFLCNIAFFGIEVFGGSVRCARTAAALTVNLGFNSRPRGKFAMKTAWVREGALRAPPRIDGVFMANFGGAN